MRNYGGKFNKARHKKNLIQENIRFLYIYTEFDTIILKILFLANVLAEKTASATKIK